MGDDTQPAYVFMSELVDLCKRHGARIFARRDSQRPYVSVEIGEVWIDLIRINGEGADWSSLSRKHSTDAEPLEFDTKEGK